MHPDLRRKLIRVLGEHKQLAFREGDPPINPDFIYNPDVIFEAEELRQIGQAYDGTETIHDQSGESIIYPKVNVFRKSELSELLGISDVRAKFLLSGLEHVR